jgi:hypothetical protein
MQMRFNRQFSICFAVGLLITLIPLVGWTLNSRDSFPPKPRLPIPGHEFLAEYGGAAADLSHYVYYQGLFGIGAKIKAADIYLLGSSHMQFGLSARVLSEQLSLAAGRTVSVYNLGVGCTESLEFGATVLRHLQVTHKSAVADAYSFLGGGLSRCARPAEAAGYLDGSIHVATAWAKYLWDWSLDGLLPTLSIRGSQALVLTRFLSTAVVYNDWQFGGATYFFRSVGEVFPESATSYRASGEPSDIPWILAKGSISVSSPEQAILQGQNIKLNSTLIPFSEAGASQAYSLVDKLLKEPPREPRWAFFPIAGAGLFTYDGGHLTGASQQIASQRLGLALVDDGVVEVLKRPPR